MDWKDMRVCVTGGCGMIGSFLSRELVELGANVRIVDNLSRGTLDNIKDIKDQVEFMKLDLVYPENAKKAAENQEKVIMLAAVLGGIDELLRIPATTGYRNLKVDLNTIEAAKNEGVKHVMFASSACTYGKECKLPCEESDLEMGKSFDSIYGRSKFMIEHIIKAYGEQYGIKSTIFRFFNVFSSAEELSLKSHVIPALCYKALVLKQDPFIVWGTGEQSRSFTHTSDIVRGILLGMERAPDGVPINLGSPRMVKIKDLAKMILKYTDYNPSKGIKFDTNKPEGAHDRCANVDRAKKLLGWESKLSVEEGLKITIDDYKKAIE